MAKVGYARVSSADQNLERQKQQLETYGVEKIYTDKQSGRDMQRPGWTALVDYIREGDELVVVSLDRLSRDYTDIKETWEYMRRNGVKINVLDQPYLHFDSGNAKMDAAMSDMFLSLMSYIADNERDKIRERQQQGIKIAKAHGAYKGRQPEYTADSKDPGKRLVYREVIKALPAIESGDLTVHRLAVELGVSRNTIIRIRKQYDQQK